MKNIQGFSLIEVLVAVVILSTALLGLVGLQATGVKNIVNSYNRTQASQLASSMADRMRANAANAALGSASTYITATAPTAPIASCTTTGCTNVQMAQNDLYEWQNALKDTGNGLVKTGTISSVDNCPTSATIQFTIIVSWLENLNKKEIIDSNNDGQPDKLEFQTIFQIPRAPC